MDDEFRLRPESSSHETTEQQPHLDQPISNNIGASVHNIHEVIQMEDPQGPLTPDNRTVHAEESMDIDCELVTAIKNKDIEIVKERIKNRTQANCKLDNMSFTILHLAAFIGADGILSYLLKCGANVNAEDKYGRIPLYFAAWYGRESCVEILIRHGADINEKTVKPENLEERKEIPNTEAQLLKDFLEEKFKEIIPVPIFGVVPLHLASAGGHVACVELLLNSGADPNIPDENQWRPLHWATRYYDEVPTERRQHVIEMLLDKEAYLDAEDEVGMTPLSYSVCSNDLPVVKLLIEKGCDVIQSNWTTSILHDAAAWGCKRAIMEVLLKRMREVLEDQQSSHTRVRERSQANELNTSGFSNLCRRLVAMIARVLCGSRSEEDDYGNDIVNSKDHNGLTPAHYAATYGHKETLQFFYDHNAFLTEKSNSGETVLDNIIHFLPQPQHFLYDILDSQIISKSVKDYDLGIEMDFSVLVKETPRNEMTFFQAIASSNDEEVAKDILQHPVMELFLGLKWNRVKLFFHCLLAIYVCFLFSFSTCVSLIVWKSENQMTNSTAADRDYKTSMVYTWYVLCIIILYISSILNILYVFVLLLVQPRYFVKQRETWRILVPSICSLAIAQCNTEMCNTAFQHITSFAIVVAWIEFMYLLGRFPSMGYYALMFSTVLKSVCKALLTFVCLIIGFTLSFYVQFNEENSFTGLWHWFVKTFTIAVGEYDYDILFNGNYLLVTSRLILVLFIILTSITLVNLLVGLAVSDIKELLVVGHVRSMMQRADFISGFEEFVSHSLLKRMLRKSFWNFINNRRSVSKKIIISPTGKYCKDPGNTFRFDLTRQQTDRITKIKKKLSKKEKKMKSRRGTNIQSSS